MCINNIQNHTFCMLLGSYPFLSILLRGVWGNILKMFILCTATRSRTSMSRIFRPRESDFTFKILQDLSTNVCNTPLDSLIHTIQYIQYNFTHSAYCQATSEVCWFGLLCGSRQSAFYRISQLNNTITYFNCQCRIPWCTQLLFIT